MVNRNEKISKVEYKKENDMILTTPYNFVPLNKKVVRPAWASLISHEKPFCDEQSGQLQLTIKAKSPIFTRDSFPRLKWEEAVNVKLDTEHLNRSNQQQKKRIEEIEREVSLEMGSHFSLDSKGQYFIPGSSLKGAIRNVLEIMCFGDLAKDLENERYGMRDLYHEDYKEMFALTASQKVHGGWLIQRNGSCSLIDCGEPEKVSQTWIDTNFHTNHFNRFTRGKMRMDDFYKSARKKYELFAGKTLSGIVYKGRTGELVFTGQPSENDIPGAKNNEFFFPDSTISLPVSEEAVKNFKLAYYDNDKNAQKPDYKYWIQELKNGNKIPVFFHKDKKGKVVSFGLAYMYKIPFTHSLKQAIVNHQKDSGNGPDMAECIFGHIQKDTALRGRVIFGHAFAKDDPHPLGVKSEVLNSPKPTYYPTYIRQEVDNTGKIATTWKKLNPTKSLGNPRGENKLTFKTLFNDESEPSGWKRYPIHREEVENNPGQNSLITKFRPLPADNTIFTCTVNYHNLNKIELGALLSALTFHNTPNCYHSLGMAKPLGYGKCTITVSGIDGKLKQECLCEFEQYMEKELNGNWLNSQQLKELIAMSQDQNNTGRSELKYMSDVKDFAKVKGEKLALDYYSKLEGINTTVIENVCTVEQHRVSTPNEIQSNYLSTFDKQKKQLIKNLTDKRNELERKEKERKLVEENQKRETEQRKIEEERISEETKKKEANRTTELKSGINLMGVNQNKTIDGLMRTLKRWKEQLGGTIGGTELEQVKNRFSQIFTQLKPRDKATWLATIKSDFPKLSAYLTPVQISEVEDFINTLS